MKIKALSAIFISLFLSFSFCFGEVYTAREIAGSHAHDADFSRANLIAARGGLERLVFFDTVNYTGYITDLNGVLVDNIDFSDAGFVQPSLFTASPFRIGFFGKTPVLTQINYRRAEVRIARFNNDNKNIEIIPLPKVNISTAAVAIDSSGCILLAVLDKNKLTLYYDSDNGFTQFAVKDAAIAGANNNVEITSFAGGSDLQFAIALTVPASSLDIARNNPEIARSIRYASSVVYTGKSGNPALSSRAKFDAVSVDGVIIDGYDNYVIDERGDKRISVPFISSMQIMENGDIISGPSIFDANIRLIDHLGELKTVKSFSPVSGGQAIAVYNFSDQSEHAAGAKTTPDYDYIYLINTGDSSVSVFDTALNHRMSLHPLKNIGNLNPVAVTSEMNNIYVVNDISTGFKIVTYTGHQLDENTGIMLPKMDGVPYIIKLEDRFIVGDLVKNGISSYGYILNNGSMIYDRSNIDISKITAKYSPKSPIILGDNGRVYLLTVNSTITTLDKNGKFISNIRPASGLDLVNVDKDGNISLIDIKNDKYVVTTFAADGRQLRWKSLDLDTDVTIFPIKMGNKVYLYIDNGNLYELAPDMSVVSKSTVHNPNGSLLTNVIAACGNSDNSEMIFAVRDRLLYIKIR